MKFLIFKSSSRPSLFCAALVFPLAFDARRFHSFTPFPLFPFNSKTKPSLSRRSHPNYSFLAPLESCWFSLILDGRTFSFLGRRHGRIPKHFLFPGLCTAENVQFSAGCRCGRKIDYEFMDRFMSKMKLN